MKIKQFVSSLYTFAAKTKNINEKNQNKKKDPKDHLKSFQKTVFKKDIYDEKKKEK